MDRFFDDVLVPGTASVDNARLSGLQPWDLEAIVSYEPAFLSGFKAQRYQVELGDGFTSAKRIMAGIIEGDVRESIGGNEQRIQSIHTNYSNLTFKHLLMPVWIAAYRYENKVYQVLVNARTGSVQGERPYSIWKIAFTVLLIIAILVLFFYLQNRKH